LRLDDLSPGDEWASPCRTVTEADVVSFAGLSGDFNPIHMDHESASKGVFRQPIAHGLLGLAMASGLSSFAPRVETVAFVSIVEWKFLEPIVFGDTIHVISRVESIEPRGRGRRGLVTWRKELVNQKGQIVQTGLTQTLVAARSADERPFLADSSADASASA
jgi:acyl dehydratase